MTTIIIIISLLLFLLPLLTFTAHVGIVDGNEAKPHSRPYMVSVQYNGEHACGGFLISEEFVLSAAHCWEKGDVLTIVVGAHKLSESKKSDRFRVKSYIPHPDFTLKPVQNDILLLKLDEKVKLNSSVGIITLPKDGEVVDDTLCSVAGWGNLWKFGPFGPLSDCLMEANISILNDAKCERRWRPKYMAPKMICAHGHGGSCSGDSGGPLVCNYTAVGVTSFGSRFRCNSPLFPTVYTKISAYLQWIRSIIGNK